LLLGRLPIARAWRGRSLRRLQPLAGGRPRGTAIVRYYWQQFLDGCHGDIRGRALEVGSTATVGHMAGSELVSVEAIDVQPRDGVQVVADLSRADEIESCRYDCFVVPFTTHLIYDIEAALFHAVRILKPGGVLLVNFPCVDYYFADGLDMGTGTPLFVFWSFTPIQVENLLRRAGVTERDFTLTTYGNLFTRVAYQMNLPAEELTAEERDHRDPGHPLLVCARIVKPSNWTADRPVYRDPWLPPTTPRRWNAKTGHYPPS
jgi:hypothetical protein